ncbi:MAG: stage III sporulation protein AF [Bacillota bacterium]
MTEWVSGIVLSIIAVTLIDVIMAEGETRKFIKGIASLLVLFAVVSPLPTLLNSGFSWDSIFSDTTTFSLNVDYLDGVNEKKIAVYQTECEEYFNSCGIEGTVVTLFYSGGDTSTPTITFAQIDIGSVIIDDNNNINIVSTIISYMQDSFGLETHMIAVIG